MTKISKTQSRLKSDQQIMWETMNQKPQFTYYDIWAVVDNRKDVTREYILRLLKAGYIEQIGIDDKTKIYKVAQKARYAPAIRRDGSETKSVDKNQRMWRAMQVQKQFTYLDIAGYSGANDATAKRYVGYLYKAGYLKLVTPCSNDSTKNIKAVYSLKQSRNTGPLSPQIKRIRVVQDANTGDVYDVRGGKDE